MLRIFIFVFLLISNCSYNKVTYWCGDHQCISNKEKEAYFKKTMTVEIKGIKKTKSENLDTAKIIEQAKVNEKARIINEKKLAKQAKLDEKLRIKNEKNDLKKIKLEEKLRLINEKKALKQAKFDEQFILKNEKKKIAEAKLNKKTKLKNDKKISKLSKSKNKNDIFVNKLKNKKDCNKKVGDCKNNISNISKMLELVLKKNSLKSYPDINNTPE